MVSFRSLTVGLTVMAMICLTWAFPVDRQMVDPSMEPQASHESGFPFTSVDPSYSPESSGESSGDNSEEVCVDASYLSQYASHHLVHTTHLTADVLCPLGQYESLPCATADHMLRVKGQSMSYRQFCESVKCTGKRMQVNSVLSHLWNDEMHHDNVALTMFDARHPESIQKALHRLISLRRSVFSRRV